METCVRYDINLDPQNSKTDVRSDAKLYLKTADETTVQSLATNYFLSEVRIKLVVISRTAYSIHSDGTLAQSRNPAHYNLDQNPSNSDVYSTAMPWILLAS